MQENKSDQPCKKENRWIPTACSICYGNCSIRCHVVDGVDYEHMDPINISMDLCAKVKIYKA